MSEAQQQQQRVPGMGEDEPLLGRAGDASQQDGKPLYHNFVVGKLFYFLHTCQDDCDLYCSKMGKLTMATSGTGVVAQAGIWIVSGSSSRPTRDSMRWFACTDPTLKTQLTAIVWGAVFSNDLILFSAHPVRPAPLQSPTPNYTEAPANTLPMFTDPPINLPPLPDPSHPHPSTDAHSNPKATRHKHPQRPQQLRPRPRHSRPSSNRIQ